MENRLTDEQIIEALECCISNQGCDNCPLYAKDSCFVTEEKAIYNLITRQKAEIEKYDKIKTTFNEFWDILLKHSIAKRKESPTLEELADGIHELEVNAIKEFSRRIEFMLSMHPAQRRYYEKIKKEYIKENQNDQ